MKNIKLLSLAALVIVSATVGALAAPAVVNTPRNQRGNEPNPLYGGYSHTRISTTGDSVICSGRCLLAGLLLNTGPGTTMVTIRNTSVPGPLGVGAIVLRHKFMTSNTFPGNNPISLPILLSKGIMLQMSAASTEEEVTVEYLDLND